MQHAVGRIHFDDVAGYARYAANVVAAETRPPSTESPRLSFFAARNDDDPATALSCEHLVTPLATALRDGWSVRSFIGPDASKDGLQAMLSGAERPDLLFTATHGIGFPTGHSDQRATQGALVCQDWPGPRHGKIGPAHWFAAPDIPDAELTGMIAFLFACFGAGTPRYDEFVRDPDSRKALALATRSSQRSRKPCSGARRVLLPSSGMWIGRSVTRSSGPGQDGEPRCTGHARRARSRAADRFGAGIRR